MKRLIISNQPILVDEDDVNHILQHNWTLTGKTAVKTRIRGNIRNLSNFIKGGYNVIFDHKDRNPYNFQKDNLRIASYSQNAMNREKVDGTSQFKGISWNSKRKLWLTVIRVNKKQIYGGYFTEKIRAAQRYNELALKYHKEFAVLNQLTNLKN